MQRKAESIEFRIAEHEKLQRQCKIRIRPSLVLFSIALALATALVWRKPDSWPLASLVLGFPTLLTGLEILGYYRHGRTLKALRGDA